MEQLEHTAARALSSHATSVSAGIGARFKHGTDSLKKEINWVQVAVDMAGGAVKVAGEIGVSRQAVYRWIERGRLGHLNAATVQKLSALSGVPIEKLI